MTQAGASEPRAIVLFNRALKRRSVQSAPPSNRRKRRKEWQPPEGLSPDEALSVVKAARCEPRCLHIDCERNELLLRVLWASGARIGEALQRTPRRIMSDSLVLPILKNGLENDGTRPWHRVFLPASGAALPGARRG